MSRKQVANPFAWASSVFAPEEALGSTQIIPTTGSHTQFYVSEWTIGRLIGQEKVVYDPDYGPGAKVYRPIGLVDAETIKGWLQ